MAKEIKASGKPIRCDCGKLVAVERDGRVYVYCKHCKKQIELNIEPRGH